MKRRWLLKRTNPEYVAYLSKAASVSPAMAQVLVNRGIKTPEEVRDFFAAGEAGFSDPLEILGVREALAAIDEARKNSTRVLVHGDYDTDGLTAAAIVSEALGKLGLETDVFIPSRFSHGYGFNAPGVEAAKQAGAGLIVTVDCGIASLDACALAVAAGIGVIVTDHHEPFVDPSTGKPILPEALAVINPKVANPSVSALAGAGVALKLAQALAARYPGAFSYREFLDLAALGTLADSVPLTGENRLIVKEGLAFIEAGARPGIRALKEVAGLGGRRLRAEMLAFTVAPRINAAGRVSEAGNVVELLMTGSGPRAEEIAGQLDRMNTERQRIEESVCEDALKAVESAGGAGQAIVLAAEGWHEGVLGIVASRLAERFMRPAFVLSIKDGVAKGSARSIPQFDILGGLKRCGDLLLSFGGHRQAAGLKLRASDVDTFREAVEKAVSGDVEDFTPTLNIEAEVGLKDISFGLVEELRRLEPFGFGNPEPVLASRGLEAMNPRVVGANHLKLRLRSKARVVDAIGFDMGGLCETVEDSPSVDAAFSATINEWEGGRTLQLNLKGLRPA